MKYFDINKKRTLSLICQISTTISHFFTTINLLFLNRITADSCLVSALT